MVRRALIHFQGHPISLLRNPCCEIALEIMLRTKTESPAKFRYALAQRSGSFSCSISKDFTVCFTRSYDDKSKTWTLVKLMRSVAIARGAAYAMAYYLARNARPPVEIGNKLRNRSRDESRENPVGNVIAWTKGQTWPLAFHFSPVIAYANRNVVLK